MAKKRRSYRRRRRYRRKRGFNPVATSTYPGSMGIGSNQNFAISKQLPVPVMFRTVLASSLSGYIASGTGPNQNFLVKLNSCNAPWNIVVVGLPFPNGDYFGGADITTYVPRSWPLWMGYTDVDNRSLYRYARVYASAVKLIVSPNDNDDDVLVTINPVRQTAYNSATTAASGPFSRERLVTSAQIDTLKNYVKVENLLGITKAKMYSDNGLRCDKKADPSEICYWQMNVTKPGGNNFVQACKYFIEVKYYLVFEQDIGAELPYRSTVTGV